MTSLRAKPLMAALFLSATLSLTPACAQTGATASVQDQILAAETNRLTAQVERNVDAVRAAVASDAVYIHANGSVQSGAEFVASIANGTTRHRAFEFSERTVRLLGSSALTHGKVVMHVGVDRQIDGRYTGVYVLKDGKWQVVSWQTTLLESQ